MGVSCWQGQERYNSGMQFHSVVHRSFGTCLPSRQRLARRSRQPGAKAWNQSNQPIGSWLNSMDTSMRPNTSTRSWNAVTLNVGDKIEIEVLPDGESDPPYTRPAEPRITRTTCSQTCQARLLCQAIQTCDRTLWEVVEQADVSQNMHFVRLCRRKCSLRRLIRHCIVCANPLLAIAEELLFINQIRAFLLERWHSVCQEHPDASGKTFPASRTRTRTSPPRMRNLVAMLWSEWKDLELQIVEMNDEVERIASSDDACRRLRQIPGIGPLVATAIVASIGNGAAFHKGREFAAWLGLLPKQHSTGGKARLSGISKRGNRYLRKILVHGARAVVLRSKRDRIAMGAWITSLEMRAPRNVLIVAMANKLARIAWAVLSTGQDYRAVPDTVAA